MLLGFGGAVAYLIGCDIYKSNVKRAAVHYIEGRKILNVGATGIGQFSFKYNPAIGDKCDIHPDIAKGIEYCDISGRLPYGEKEFDVVFASHVLEHVKPSDAVNALVEFVRVAREVVVVLPHPLDMLFYLVPEHKSLIYKTDSGLYIKNNGGEREEYLVELDGRFKIFQ